MKTIFVRSNQRGLPRKSLLFLLQTRNCQVFREMVKAYAIQWRLSPSQFQEEVRPVKRQALRIMSFCTTVPVYATEVLIPHLGGVVRASNLDN